MNAAAQQKNISALYYKHGNENPKTKHKKNIRQFAKILEPRAQANHEYPVRDANHQKIPFAPQSPVSRK
jgi:hypothetical protein